MKLMLLIHLLLFTSKLWADSSLLGKWKTIDDETHRTKSVVEIYEKDGIVYGKIERLFRSLSEDPNPKCDKCSGDKKNQQIIGMQFLSGLKKDSENNWSGGYILDPNNGKTYSCKIELIEGGAKLKVRGFIGFSLFGRTQIWEREPVEESKSTISPTAPAPVAVPAKKDVTPPKN